MSFYVFAAFFLCNKLGITSSLAFTVNVIILQLCGSDELVELANKNYICEKIFINNDLEKIQTSLKLLNSNISMKNTQLTCKTFRLIVNENTDAIQWDLCKYWVYIECNHLNYKDEYYCYFKIGREGVSETRSKIHPWKWLHCMTPNTN